MLTSLHWLNRYLDPADLTADEAERVLTSTSFPIESRENLPDNDAVLDVEVTSNRGDCLCHAGLAREIASATGRRFVPPNPKLPISRGARGAAEITGVTNEVPALCPRFTARVITGVKVGPSPAWLASALEAVGQRPINNVVDVSNYVLFELGHPSHTFDLNTLAGKRLTVRHARAGESLAALDGRTHKLLASDLVVADAEKAQSLAGVVGGRETGVSENTADVLLEVATWDPPTIRRTARRLGIITDAGKRFERIVDARDLEWASARCAQLILEVAGGTLADGLIDVGAPLAPRRGVKLRVARCERLLGITLPGDHMVRLLQSMGIEVSRRERDVFECIIPNHRPDLTREVDLIEEIARLNQIDNIPIAASLPLRLDLKHPDAWTKRERAAREAALVLTGLGCSETVTFSFLPKASAAPFLPPGLRLLKVDEDRRKDMPYLRPSIIPSLLTCWRANRDAGAPVASGVRFYETASVFAEGEGVGAGAGAGAVRTIENRNLGLLVTAPSPLGRDAAREHAFAALKGIIETLVGRLSGNPRVLTLQPSMAPFAALEERGGLSAGILLNGAPAGHVGLLSDAVLGAFEVDVPAAAAEVNLASLFGLYPPVTSIRALPEFPAHERDLSFVVDEATPWGGFEHMVLGLNLPRLEALEFVGVFRGKPIAPGKKSVTLRLRFVDPTRTLRREEVEPQIEALVSAAKAQFGAELRV